MYQSLPINHTAGARWEQGCPFIRRGVGTGVYSLAKEWGTLTVSQVVYRLPGHVVLYKPEIISIYNQTHTTRRTNNTRRRRQHNGQAHYQYVRLFLASLESVPMLISTLQRSALSASGNTRYGACLRQHTKRFEINQHARYEWYARYRSLATAATR